MHIDMCEQQDLEVTVAVACLIDGERKNSIDKWKVTQLLREL
jgi:hypothetical protein